MIPKTVLPSSSLVGIFWIACTLLWASCSSESRVLIFADPYGKEVFPEMEASAQSVADEMGISLRWVSVPVQAEVPVFPGSVVPGETYSGILLPDLYESEVKESLAEIGAKVVLWGYGSPSESGPSVGWDRLLALEGLLKSVIQEEELLRRPKPILFAAIFGPEGTQVQEESLIRSTWARSFGPDRLWIYRTSNTLDRGLALQAASAVLGQNVDMVYVDAGRMSPEIFRSLKAGTVRLGLSDWASLNLEEKKVRYSLERDWKIFWKEAFLSVQEDSDKPRSVPFALKQYFSPENSPLKSFHIR